MAAKRFRDLQRPALIDLGARTTNNGSAQAAAQLSDSLASFSRTGFDIATNLRAVAGERAGAKAGAEGVPEFRDGFRGMTAFGAAYNNSALRGYAINAEQDLEENAARMEEEAGTNPEAFRAGIDAALNGILQEAPEQTQDTLKQIYNKRASEGIGRINQKLAVELREEDRVLSEQKVEQLIENISFLRASTDPAAHLEAQQEEAKMFLLIDALETDGVLSEVEAGFARTRARDGIIFETVRQMFVNELSDPQGDPLSFMENIRETNRVSEALPPDKEELLEGALWAELRDHNALVSARATQEAASDKIRMDAGRDEAAAAFIGKELTSQGILDRLRPRDGSPPTITGQFALTLQNELNADVNNPPKSDPLTLLEYQVNILEYSEDEIWNEGGIVTGDKSALIKEREKLDQGFTKTDRYKEAVARINGELGIPRGMSTFDIGEDRARTQGRALRELWNRIEEIGNDPEQGPNQRDELVLEVADDIIEVFIKKDDRRKAAIAERRLADDIEAAIEKYGPKETWTEEEREDFDDQVSTLRESIERGKE